MTYQVDILNPKASKLLQDLADMNLITFKKTTENSFFKVIDSLRSKAATNPPSLEDITKEVELVRAKRYAQNKK